jgi:hypothetical protein
MDISVHVVPPWLDQAIGFCHQRRTTAGNIARYDKFYEKSIIEQPAGVAWLVQKGRNWSRTRLLVERMLKQGDEIVMCFKTIASWPSWRLSLRAES